MTLDEGDLIISRDGNDFLEGGNGKPPAGRPLACGPRTRVLGVWFITPPIGDDGLGGDIKNDKCHRPLPLAASVIGSNRGRRDRDVPMAA